MLVTLTSAVRMRLASYARYTASPRRYSALPSLSGPLHFYQNKQLDLYASRNATPLTLRQLVHFCPYYA